MSTTTAGVNAKEFLTDFIKRVSEGYVSDLSHIPQDKLGASPMGVARTALEFTAECIGFNQFVAKALRGETVTRRTPEEREAFLKSINSFDAAKEGILSSAAELADAVANCSDEGLAEEVAAPWGDAMPRYQLAHMAAVHMNYHLGQVNYIQTLYGDAENHWA